MSGYEPLPGDPALPYGCLAWPEDEAREERDEYAGDDQTYDREQERILFGR